MPRLAGVNIPDNKKIRYALTSIKGVGLPSSDAILEKAKVDPEKRAKELSPEELNQIKRIIDEGYKIEGDLAREVMMHIRRLKEIGSWRGFRHNKRLPVRGQRTRTNNRTVRGNVRKTVTSGKKPPPSPT